MMKLVDPLLTDNGNNLADSPSTTIPRNLQLCSDNYPSFGAQILETYLMDIVPEGFNKCIFRDEETG